MGGYNKNFPGSGSTISDCYTQVGFDTFSNINDLSYWRILGVNQSPGTRVMATFTGFNGEISQDHELPGANAKQRGIPPDSSNQTMVTTGTYDPLGDANQMPVFYGFKSWSDTVPAAQYAGAANTFEGKAMYDSWQSVTPQGFANTLSGYLLQLRTAYIVGAWPSGTGGWLCDVDSFSKIEPKAYWNFEDPASWAIQGGSLPATVKDMTGNGNNLTIGGSTLTQNSIYSVSSPFQGGMDFSQGAGSGANYATCASNISIASTSYCLIGYVGSRHNNTSAARYIWDARDGGGDYMQTVSSGNGWNFNNALLGGTSTQCSRRHIMTALVSPNGGTSYGHVSVNNASGNDTFFSSIFSGTPNNGANQIGSNLYIGTNYNNIGSQLWPGFIGQFFIVELKSGITASEALLYAECVHYHFKWSIATNY